MEHLGVWGVKAVLKYLNISGFEKQNEKGVRSWKEKRVGYFEMKCHCGKVTSNGVSA